MKLKLPELGFTTLISKNIPIGMKIKKTMENFPYAFNYGRNKVELKTKYNLKKIYFNFEAFYRKLRKC